MFKDSAVLANWRNIESLFDVFPIHNIAQFAGHNSHSFGVPVTQNRREIWLNGNLAK